MSDERSEGSELSAPNKIKEQTQYKKRKDIVHGDASGEIFASKGRDVNELFTNSCEVTHLKYKSAFKKESTPQQKTLIY